MHILEIKKRAKDILLNGSVEGSSIEYKKSLNFKDKILKTICAFANNYMNDEICFLFVGVEEIDDKSTGDRGIPRRPISGIPNSQIETTENEIKSILSNITPKVKYELFSDTLDNTNYVAVAVEPNHDGPFETTDKGRVTCGLKPGRYVRTERETRLATRNDEKALLNKFTDYSFTSELNDKATLQDLNIDYIKDYLYETGSKLDFENLSKLDLARSMKLVTEEKYGEVRVKNFAVLMFVNKPRDFIPEAYIKVIREVSGTDKMQAQDFDGPIWRQVKKVVQYFKEEVMREYTLRFDDKIEHEIIANYPLVAFEELLTNAVLHKEYDKHEYIGVYIYKDSISIVNHNKPLPPVTIEAMNSQRYFDRREYINKEIKEMFFALNLIETYGSGIRRAKDELEKNGSPELRFYPENENEDCTQVVITIHEEFFKEENSIQPKPRDYGRISKIAIEILNIIEGNSLVTVEEIANKIPDITTRGIRYHIDKLKGSGILERKGSKRNGYWEINYPHK